jgi:hypothetical protein
VAIRARGSNAEGIGDMRTMPVLLKWRAHLVTRGAKGFRGGVVKSTQRCGSKARAHHDCQQPPDG